jgi:hypothetical protein
MSYINNKIENALNDLIEKSRVQFENSLNMYAHGLREDLYAKEREMRPQSLVPMLLFSFTVSTSYETEKGPLFPQMPAAAAKQLTILPVAAKNIPLHDYCLRRSARKPTGYYAE